MLASVVIMTGTTAHAQSCDSYVGQTIAPKTFDQALASINPPAPKGEFEITATYQARTQNSGAVKQIISKRMESPKYLEYDADKGAFTVLSYLFDNSNFPVWKTLYRAKAGLNANTSENRDVLISQSDAATGSYVGQNGFGAKAHISKITRTIKGIYEAPAGFNEGLFPDQHGVIGSIPMDAPHAMAFKQQAKIAFVVIPKLPYIVKAMFTDGDATIDDPRDIQINSTILIADIQCGLLTDGANKVVAAYTTR